MIFLHQHVFYDIKVFMSIKIPLITAHEGCENSPGNTISSVQTGIDAKADIIEVDVRSTNDKIAILSHNSYIKTNSNEKLAISDLNFSDLLRMEKEKRIIFDHNKGKITKLVEIFDLIRTKNKILNLDIKEDESIEPTVAAVKNSNMLDYIVISGCERIRASYLKKNFPEFQVLFNVGETLSDLVNIDYKSAVKTVCRYAIQAGCCGINIPYQICTEELVNYAHLRFLPVSVWTIDDIAEMQKYINMGVFSITTKKPIELRKIFDGY